MTGELGGGRWRQPRGERQQEGKGEKVRVGGRKLSIRFSFQQLEPKRPAKSANTLRNALPPLIQTLE